MRIRRLTLRLKSTNTSVGISLFKDLIVDPSFVFHVYQKVFRSKNDDTANEITDEFWMNFNSDSYWIRDLIQFHWYERIGLGSLPILEKGMRQYFH